MGSVLQSNPGAEIFAYPEEPTWLVSWILSDVAQRPPAKRQRAPMSGMWMSRQGRGQLRRSDQAERNYVAIAALLTAGQPLKVALAEVAGCLGKATAKEMEVLRTGVYRFKSPLKKHLLERWLSQFRDWTDWVISTPDQSIASVVRKYNSAGQLRHAALFLNLVKKIRRKSRTLKQVSLYKDASWYERAERYEKAAVAKLARTRGPDQHFIGMRFITLARLYHEQRKFNQAMSAYKRAAPFWRRAHITTELRELMLEWLNEELHRCGSGAPPGPMPVYSDRWIPDEKVRGVRRDAKTTRIGSIST